MVQTSKSVARRRTTVVPILECSVMFARYSVGLNTGILSFISKTFTNNVAVQLLDSVFRWTA